MGGVDYYELLGVDRSASTADIRAAYRTMAKVMHPDAGGSAGTFTMLRQAYETLRDPDRRATYDRTGQPVPLRPSRRAARHAPADHAERSEWTARDRFGRTERTDRFGESERSNRFDRTRPDGFAGTEQPDRFDRRPRTEQPDRAERISRAERVARMQRRGQTGRLRGFGADPEFVPPPLRLDLDTLPWWPGARATARVRYTPSVGPSVPFLLTMIAGWVLLTVVVSLAPLESIPLLAVGWGLVVCATVGALVAVRRYLLARLADRAFAEGAGGRVVFGRPGADTDHLAERLTAGLLAEYLAPLPGTRIFHGLGLPDSVFADVHHAALRGRRLVLVESKQWLPGHYTADDAGTVWRNGHPFRGGSITLPEAVAAYRELLPGVEVRGVLVVYPSRAGEVTTGEPFVGAVAPPMTPADFVREIGEWLGAEPATVDRDVFRAVLDRVVSHSHGSDQG